MKVGRNDPCPCGSGQKFKKCCLGKTVVSSEALHYRRLSEVHDRLVDRLAACAERIFGDQAVHVALHEFLLWPDAQDEMDEEMLARIGPLFWPWYLFNWEYDPIDGDVALAGPQDLTVAELYAEERGARLDPMEKKLIDGINREPYSFWEVLDTEKGKGMTLHDVLRDIRIAVQERTGSEYVKPGDMLFGRAVSVDGVGMLIGLGTTLIPPGRKTQIIALRKRMRREQADLDSDALHQWDTEIRELFFFMDHALHTPPEMHNTDGDPLELHRLVYEVSSAAEAFDKLCDLCVTMNREELTQAAERDEAGRIIQVEIPWDRKGHKSMAGLPNTILGRIVVDGGRLTAEVNSAKRARELRRKIDTRLGDAGRFQVDEIQDMDGLMSKAAARAADAGRSREHEELMQHPELREQLAEMLMKHWESWVDQKIPALGGQSPRKAVKTRDGREAVEALLQEAEQDRGQEPLLLEANRKGAKRVREILGIGARTKVTD